MTVFWNEFYKHLMIAFSIFKHIIFLCYAMTKKDFLSNVSKDKIQIFGTVTKKYK